MSKIEPPNFNTYDYRVLTVILIVCIASDFYGMNQLVVACGLLNTFLGASGYGMRIQKTLVSTSVDKYRMFNFSNDLNILEKKNSFLYLKKQKTREAIFGITLVYL